MKRILLVLVCMTALVCVAADRTLTATGSALQDYGDGPTTRSAYVPQIYTNKQTVWFLGQSNANGVGSRSNNALGSLTNAQAHSWLKWEYMDHNIPSAIEVFRGVRPMVPFYTNIWGMEVTFADEVNSLTGDGVGVIKTAMGSATIFDDWPKVGGTRYLYDRSLQQLGRSFREMRAHGQVQDMRALVWIQGYGDAGTEARSLAYYSGLTNLMADFRSDSGYGTNMHITIGRCSIAMTNTRTDAWLETVRDAQTNAAGTLVNASWFDMDDIPMRTDSADAYVHYSDLGLMYIGRRVASNLVANGVID